MISFIRSNPHIYQSSATNYFPFGIYFNYGIIFYKVCQKGKIFEEKLKNETNFIKKS